MVIVGNPPYNASSTNKYDVSNYKQIDGNELNEKNSKQLQDDYVKFIRWAQKRIEFTSYGIIAFITNHAYIDNITFSGMRKSLMDTFDEIYILDLHGNLLKKEKCPDGSKDENVFNIKQGVAISIFVKKELTHSNTIVNYAELYGTRDYKYNSLNFGSVFSTQFEEVKPQGPDYIFKPLNKTAIEYNNYFSLDNEIFLKKSTCISTGNDNDTIAFTKDGMKTIICDFVKLSNEEGRNKFSKRLTRSGSGWSFDKAKTDVIKTGADDKNIVELTYRPFDNRYTYFTGKAGGFHERPRKMMCNLANKDNFAIIGVRQIVENEFNHIFISKTIADKHIMGGNSYIFPLYVYGENGTEISRTSNLNPEFIDKIEFTTKLKLGVDFDYEDVLYYIYSIINSPFYRSRYITFLKYGYPKIPITSNVVKFKNLCKLGEMLTQSHLLEDEDEVIGVSYPIEGGNVISKVTYENDRLYINDTQFFEGVPSDVYNVVTGGYKVVKKWLDSRSGHRLKYTDIEYLKKMFNAIKSSLNIQKEIDKVIVGFPMEVFDKSMIPNEVDTLSNDVWQHH